MHGKGLLVGEMIRYDGIFLNNVPEVKGRIITINNDYYSGEIK